MFVLESELLKVFFTFSSFQMLLVLVLLFVSNFN